MKRTLICFALLMLAVACVPTPTEEAVVNKAEGALEQRIESAPVTEYRIEADPPHGDKTDEPTAIEPRGESDPENGPAASIEPDAKPAQNTLAESLGVPLRCTDSAEGKVFGGKLIVTIDAAVSVPNVSAVPVFSVRDKVFSASDKERIVRMLIGDGPYYNINYDLMQQQSLLHQIEETNKAFQKYDDRVYGEEFPYDDYRWGDEQNLKRYMKGYAELTPGPMVPWTGSFSDETPAAANADNMYVRVKDGEIVHYGANTDGLGAIAGHAPRNDREREAAAAAKELFDRFGEDTFTVLAVEGNEDLLRATWNASLDYEADWYSVTLTREFAGIPYYAYSTYNGSDTGQQAAGFEIDYDKRITPEHAEASVQNGEVTSLWWYGIFEITGTENENVPLLPFDEILKTFKKQIFRSIYLDPPEKGSDESAMCMVVDRICLSYMRVKKQDAEGESYLLPVWDFLGYDYNPSDPHTEHDLIGTKAWFSSQSLLTINAIDGSVINRNVGY